jgi:hypothetical protein
MRRLRVGLAKSTEKVNLTFAFYSSILGAVNRESNGYVGEVVKLWWL